MKMISSVADRGGPLLSDFHTSNNINDLHLDMYVPLFKEIGGEGRKCMGILFFRINLYFAVGISFSA
jgi:hypothetical protein